jgi:hypothetical protein
MRICNLRSAICILIAAAAAVPAAAQGEDALRSFFEGRRITVKIDMPGTSDGVDLYVDQRQPLDYKDYGDRLKRNGVAIRQGESVVVTRVKVKDEIVEFQLAGGGFGTFSDDTSTSVNIPHVEKSNREKDLEKQVRDETDRRRRRDLQDELDRLRDRRERENRRIDAERARAEEIKKERIAAQRLRGGSRFNLRYGNEVPPGLRPEDVMTALADYVDFASAESSPPPAVNDAYARPIERSIRKGMTRAEVQRVLGQPTSQSERREGALDVSTLVFASGDQRVTVDFVDDIVVRYTITSR